eukprot:Phypoly_transcript_11967.p1 GENE.Phypoly_transcript_11967~~Phypoly_transcript_11967.p1  ORF type:complete len:362 (+),score=58.85 Phypoly_transcript_11967:36-1088(+)
MAEDGVQVFIAADDGTLSGTKEEREAKLAERRLFEIDQYYHLIEPYTFKTVFIDISVEQGQAWRDFNRGAKLDEAQTKILEELKSNIDKPIKEFVAKGNAAFFRLSTRSPKDAVDKIEKLKLLLCDQFRSSLEKYKQELDYNQKLVALRRAFFKAMSVKSVDEALQLVMYSSRAISDMKRALDNLDVSPWNMKAIVREFVDIPIEGEFRGFVHNKKLNALSQYYADCYFEDLPPRREAIGSAVQKFFYSHIQSLLPFDSYIIDFVVFKNNDVMIVELNPYSVTTGACLFDWQKDKAQLENGPFELRVNTEPVKNVNGYLVPFNALVSQALREVESAAKQKHGNGENCIIS